MVFLLRRTADTLRCEWVNGETKKKHALNPRFSEIKGSEYFSENIYQIKMGLIRDSQIKSKGKFKYIASNLDLQTTNTYPKL